MCYRNFYDQPSGGRSDKRCALATGLVSAWGGLGVVGRGGACGGGGALAGPDPEQCWFQVVLPAPGGGAGWWVGAGARDQAGPWLGPPDPGLSGLHTGYMYLPQSIGTLSFSTEIGLGLKIGLVTEIGLALKIGLGSKLASLHKLASGRKLASPEKLDFRRKLASV